MSPLVEGDVCDINGACDSTVDGVDEMPCIWLDVIGMEVSACKIVGG